MSARSVEGVIAGSVLVCARHKFRMACHAAIGIAVAWKGETLWKISDALNASCVRHFKRCEGLSHEAFFDCCGCVLDHW